MPTVVVGRLDPAGFPLSRTLDAFADVEFEVERVVLNGDTLTALVWAYAPDHAALEAALEDDPSVGDHVRMADLDSAGLYRMEWVRDLSFLQFVLREAKATILDGFGTRRRWRLCLAYPDHEGIKETDTFCQSRDLEFDVSQVQTVPDGPIDRYGLSAEQYEALSTAWRLGYFDVPRKVDLQDVADEIGISHQAASERLRRGHETVIRELLGMTAREQVHTG